MLNPNAVRAHFQSIENLYNEQDIQDADCYAANETCLWDFLSVRECVVCATETDWPQVQQSGDQEITSVLAIICANGRCLPPFIIFKGEQLHTSWGLNTLGDQERTKGKKQAEKQQPALQALRELDPELFCDAVDIGDATIDFDMGSNDSSGTETQADVD